MARRQIRSANAMFLSAIPSDLIYHAAEASGDFLRQDIAELDDVLHCSRPAATRSRYSPASARACAT